MTTSPAFDPVPVPALLRRCMHLLVLGLLALVVVRAVSGGSVDVVAAVLVGPVGSVYLVGVLIVGRHRDAGSMHDRVIGRRADSNRGSDTRPIGSRPVRRCLPRSLPSRAVTGTWLALLLGCWLALLMATRDAVYLAFPWFFLILHLLPRRSALPLVGATTAAAVGGFAWHAGTLTAAMAIGPVLGAGVAIATAWGYQAVHAESEQRRRLIERLRRTQDELAAAERRSGVLGERERLAREIHDTLAQGLTSIQLLLRAAGRNLPPGPESERAAGLIEQARGAAQENLVEARRFVAALAPSDLERSSLAAALQRLCDTSAERSGTAVTFREVGIPISLPTPVEAALLRIAQSTVGNADRHARATRVGVTLTHFETTVSLDVVDDGVGFDPTDQQLTAAGPGPDGGFGLTSMRSRASEIGATLTVESAPGRGTAVAVIVDAAVPGGAR